MTFTKLLPYLIPVLKILIELLKPTLKKLLEQLWEKVESEIEERLADLTVPKSQAKRDLFNTEAYKIYTEKGIDITEAKLNLVREVIHTKLSKKA